MEYFAKNNKFDTVKTCIYNYLYLFHVSKTLIYLNINKENKFLKPGKLKTVIFKHKKTVRELVFLYLLYNKCKI